MTKRLPLVHIAAALALLVVGGPPAAGTASAAPRGDAQVLRFNFDNGESLRPGTRVRNVAGRGEGRVLVSDGGRLRRVEGVRGRGAKFPAACGTCGKAIIEAGDRNSFDPRRRGFTYGAVLKMTPSEGNSDSNIVQKGYFSQAGGQYKLQTDQGRPSCVVNGRAGRLIARSNVDVSNRRWHRVTCQRTRTAVILRIDGAVRGRARGVTGHLANEAPIRVGGRKVAGVETDQYHGRLDNVFVRIRGARR
jgi:hypothetical protein